MFLVDLSVEPVACLVVQVFNGTTLHSDFIPLRVFTYTALMGAVLHRPHNENEVDRPQGETPATTTNYLLLLPLLPGIWFMLDNLSIERFYQIIILL